MRTIARETVNLNCPKKVLILSTAYAPLIGGSELAIRHVTDRMPDVAFDLITSRPDPDLPDQERIGRVRVFRVGGAWTLFPFLVPKALLPLAIFWKARTLIARGERYDLIHAFQASQAGGAGLLLKWFYPALPFLVTLQEGKDMRHQPFLVHFLRSLVVRGADAVTVISAYLERYVRSLAPSQLVRLVPNGVDVEAFSKPVASEVLTDLRRQLGIGEHTRVVISVSRLVEKNGLPNLIRAFKEVRDTLDAHLVLIGSGPLRSELRELVERLGVSSSVSFLGDVFHERVPRYLHLADVFVRPSLSEGLGTAFLEAMAARVPVVGSAVGGIPDFLHDGQTGLLCDPRDPDSIGGAVTKSLQDRELSAALRENALHLVRERYSWDVVARQMQEAYCSLV